MVEEIVINNVEIVNPYGFIYITTNMMNGKKYIGQRKLNDNWKGYLGSGKILKRAVKKYGRENFSREIIAVAYSKEKLSELEIAFIKYHNASNSRDYYNITNGGEGFPFKHSLKSRQKMSNSQKGRIVSDETKIKLGIAHKGEKNHNYGKHLSIETRQKLSLAKTGENHWIYGKHHSEETKNKMSEANKGEKNWHYGMVTSDETKMKLSFANKGEKSGSYGKVVSDETKLKMREAKMKFNDKQLTEIREKYSTGDYKQVELAREYNCASSVISYIVNFKQAYAKVI